MVVTGWPSMYVMVTSFGWACPEGRSASARTAASAAGMSHRMVLVTAVSSSPWMGGSRKARSDGSIAPSVPPL